MMLRRSLVAVLALSVAGGACAQVGALPGVWTGVIVDGETRLRLRLQVEDGGKVQLESLDQAPDFFFPGQVSATGAEVEIAFPTIDGLFKGHRAGPDRIEGVWRQIGEFPLVLVRGEGGLDLASPASRE